MTRKAFLGLSSPIAYDYKNTMDKIHPKDASAPNPILEDAMGLLLLYDEIVFLSPHICPKNMRELPYVSFLNERADFDKTTVNLDFDQFKSILDPLDQGDRGTVISIFRERISAITGIPDGPIDRKTTQFLPDNHTHSIWLSNNVSLSASSLHLGPILMDWELIDAFGLHDCDPIYNSANAKYYEHIHRSFADSNRQMAIVQELIVRHLPNYLGTIGPYHECIEDLRNHAFLENIRGKLDELVSNSNRKEISNCASELEALARKYQNEVFQKYLSPRNVYYTVGKAAITDASGLILPGAGLITELIGTAIQEPIRKRMRWAGFVADIPYTVDRASTTIQN